MLDRFRSKCPSAFNPTLFSLLNSSFFNFFFYIYKHISNKILSYNIILHDILLLIIIIIVAIIVEEEEEEDVDGCLSVYFSALNVSLFCG